MSELTLPASVSLPTCCEKVVSLAPLHPRGVNTDNNINATSGPVGFVQFIQLVMRCVSGCKGGLIRVMRAKKEQLVSGWFPLESVLCLIYTLKQPAALIGSSHRRARRGLCWPVVSCHRRATNLWILIIFGFCMQDQIKVSTVLIMSLPVCLFPPCGAGEHTPVTQYAAITQVKTTQCHFDANRAMLVMLEM